MWHPVCSWSAIDKLQGPCCAGVSSRNCRSAIVPLLLAGAARKLARSSSAQTVRRKSKVDQARFTPPLAGRATNGCKFKGGHPTRRSWRPHTGNPRRTRSAVHQGAPCPKQLSSAPHVCAYAQQLQLEAGGLTRSLFRAAELKKQEWQAAQVWPGGDTMGVGSR